MAEAQYASLDGAVSPNMDEAYFQPNPNAIARRSISIFSRKGTETPEPKPPFIAQEAMRMPKQMTERQKSWVKRRSISGGSSPKAQSKPKGTILNAVPPAQIIKMTALEEEMATSPNEEILSAVSDHSVTQVAWTAATHRSSPSEATAAPPVSLWNRGTAPLVQRTKSTTKRDSKSRIGVWVDGVAHWEGARPSYEHVEDRIIEQETGFTPVRPVSGDMLTTKNGRPNLSVLIPGNDTRRNTMALSTIVQPKPCRPVVSVAPASIVSRFNWTPLITVDEPREGSPTLSATSIQRTPPPEECNATGHLDTTGSPADRAKRASRTSSSSSLTEHDDDASSYSKRSNRSSATSVEATPPQNSSDVLANRASSIDEAALLSVEGLLDLNKPLPPCPERSPQRKAPKPPAVAMPSEPSISRWSRISQSTKSAPSRTTPFEPVRRMASSRSLTALDHLDQDFMSTSPYPSEVSESDSPTLSQAEQELHAHLSEISQDAPAHLAAPDNQSREAVMSRSTSIRRGDSVRSVMHPPERAPTLPKRSRKRDWRKSPRNVAPVQEAPLPVRRQSEIFRRTDELGEGLHPGSLPVRRARSINAMEMRQIYLAAQQQYQREAEHDDVVSSNSSPPTIIIDDGLVVVNGPVVLAPPIAVASAEAVLLHILESLNTLDDLFNTATINKGMYRVYKENEMDLIRTVAFNQSPAASEFREWCPPDSNEVRSSGDSEQLEHTPKTYVNCYRRDLAVIESLKSLMLKHCQTFIRRDTALAFATPSHSKAQRFNDAFWRIWCFCNIFGNGKSREDDITGQVDWLRGGLLANNQGAVATVNMNLEYDMGSVLLNAPEFFAKGNVNGLSAQQLYDMTEIWTCLSALLHGYQGRISQAREYGVFDACEVTTGHIEKEELLLEEWTYYLLTLGPAVVLEMAIYALDSSSAGFALAKQNGWTRWAPHAVTGSRNVFLKEPVSRLYEERIAAAASQLSNPREQEKKEMSRKRVANLAAEIRLKRQSSTYKRSPYIDMHTERAMSVMTRRSSTASYRSDRSHRSERSSTSSAYSFHPAPVSAVTPSIPNFSSPRHTAPNSGSQGVWHSRKISPIIEDRVETFNRLSLVNFAAGIAEDTSERAVSTIVDMGFSAAQAKEALKATDLGDGLRVDRAVELLLRART